MKGETLKNIFLLLTAPFWLPWVWFKEKLAGPNEGNWKIARIILQLVATIITSFVYIVFWMSLFSGERPVRDDDYYERQDYYERTSEPGW